MIPLLTMDQTALEGLQAMKVLNADGTTSRMKYITNDVDDIGNAIAEGRMTEAERFSELARRYKVRFVRAEAQLYDYKEKHEREVYAASWIRRFTP